jgi:PAS domain-containing protein
MEGVINFWNRDAEVLYGWRKEEAIGKVSHDLLQTEFPRPLEDIESELVRNGGWEGKLVHTTRDGRRVTVRSQWSLNPGKQRKMVTEINAHSQGGETLHKARPKAVVFADVILAVVFSVCAATFVYYAYYYNIIGQRYFASQIGVILYQVMPAGAAMLLLAAFRLPSAYRLNLALVLCSAGFSLFTAELLLRLPGSMSSSVETLWGDGQFEDVQKKEIVTLAKQFSVDFDTRSRLEVVTDLRKQHIEAFPSIIPLGLLKKDPDGRFKSKISIDGQEVFPLGGISNSVTVLCNETGRYSIYESDERGFHNPRGIWGSEHMTIAAVGDSFTEGACVPTERNFMALIRNRYPAAVNLGMCGEGPLIMLAALTEYLPAVKPNVVLWFFFEGNDFAELSKESKSTLLRQYVGDNFNQGLVDRQAEIDQALIQYVEREMGRELAKKGEAAKGDGESDESWYRFRTLLEVLKLTRLRRTLGLVHGRAVEDSEGWYSQEQLTLFRSILLQAKHLVAEWDGTLHFVYLPARDRYANAQDYHRQEVLDVVKQIGVPIIDVHARFQRESDPMKLFPFGRFGHYNEEGNRLVAEEVLRFIRLKNDR